MHWQKYTFCPDRPIVYQDFLARQEPWSCCGYCFIFLCDEDEKHPIETSRGQNENPYCWQCMNLAEEQNDSEITDRQTLKLWRNAFNSTACIFPSKGQSWLQSSQEKWRDYLSYLKQMRERQSFMQKMIIWIISVLNVWKIFVKYNGCACNDWFLKYRSMED